MQDEKPCPDRYLDTRIPFLYLLIFFIIFTRSRETIRIVEVTLREIVILSLIIMRTVNAFIPCHIRYLHAGEPAGSGERHSLYNIIIPQCLTKVKGLLQIFIF